MRMKKVLIVIAVLLAVFAGLFFWKGGHHALILANVLEEWLDADNGDQSLTIQLQIPDASTDAAGEIEPEVQQWTLSADSFWTEYADERVFGLCAEGVTAYLGGGNLYLDTGRTYSLPDLSELNIPLRDLAAGLLLYGRVTKTGDTYHISMKTEELELSASVTANQTVRAVTVNAILPDGKALHAAVTPKETVPHPIPQPVADAMVRARTKQPMALTEPLEVLLPALEGLLPLSGDLKLGVSCGILELSETVQLTVSGGKAALTRKGKTLELSGELSDLSPAAAAVLLLRDGEFTQNGDQARFSMVLPEDTTTALLEALVPQAADLDIALENSALSLCINAGRLTSAALTAKGSVPFLFTTIPVDFSADLTIS